MKTTTLRKVREIEEDLYEVQPMLVSIAESLTPEQRRRLERVVERAERHATPAPVPRRQPKT